MVFSHSREASTACGADRSGTNCGTGACDRGVPGAALFKIDVILIGVIVPRSPGSGSTGGTAHGAKSTQVRRKSRPAAGGEKYKVQRVHHGAAA